MPIISVLCLLAIYTSAQAIVSSQLITSITEVLQEPKKPEAKKQQPIPKPKVIEVIRADVEQRLGFEPIVMTDSIQVILYHDGAYLYCDSAYYNTPANSFDAFGHVRMEQGDTLFLYGTYMHYDGNTKLVQVRENVKLDHGKGTLFTDNLDYDRMINIGYYFDGGLLVDSINELTSLEGQYEPNFHLATFKDSVVLTNPNFVLHSNLLKYNTQNNIATILSPSTILSDSGTIHTSRGWYNTATDQSVLLDQSLIVNKPGDRTLTGDSIFYNRKSGYGEVFGNMFMQDTTKKVILRGHYGFYNQKTNDALATDSAYCIEYSQKDSLYIHADTLKMRTDSIYREMKAYHGVRFFRTDVQGICDSMQFNSRDTILHLYKEPVLWNTTNQLSGDTIDIFMNDSTIELMHVKRYSFSIEQKDSLHYNQLKGRSSKFFFRDGGVWRILVEGDVETLYYGQEKDSTLVIANKLEGSYLNMILKDGKMERLSVVGQNVGKTTPIELLTTEQLRLKNFFWYDYLRPLNKDDIFRKVKRKAGDLPPKRLNISSREE